MITGCATYHEQSIRFQEEYALGNLEEANELLDKNSKASSDKNRLLYFLHKGATLHLMGAYEESNQYFEQAYIFDQDYRKNYALEAASLITNPMVKPYTGEDHELVLMHYYKAINFLKLGDYEAALVEVRRINIKLNELNDLYGDKQNRYSQDAFAHNLMGIIYEASGDINNAFIAYRNAYHVYQEDYTRFFGMGSPEQLKDDLLRTAFLLGFTEELAFYEGEFGAKYKHQKSTNGELVFFWHNGLGPVKGEWSINFAVIKGEGGAVVFENDEYGWSFPFFLSDDDGDQGLGDLKVVRVAFPKYLRRNPVYTEASIAVGNKQYSLQLAQDINEIAFKTLEDRMLRELGTSLLRLALKQGAEKIARDENEGFGAVISMVNAFTEKADTRNWQTLPYAISYSRVPLKQGENNVRLNVGTLSRANEITEEFNFTGTKGETVFHMFHHMESEPVNRYDY